MKPINWPNGARCAVALTFDFDAETNWISRDPRNIKRPGTLSQGTYGAKVGILEILALLNQEDLKATFFVPGWIAENRTDRVERIHRAGHEIGHHGYLHKWVDPDNPEEELNELERGLRALRDRLGVSPVGYRSPAGETTPRLIDLLSMNGFLYDSSLMDDVNPYIHPSVTHGKNLVELPWHWSLDDAPFMLSSIAFHRPIFTNEHIYKIWTAEFEAIYEWGGLFLLTMHPQAIGRPSRLRLLRDFIAHTRKFDKIWYAKCHEVAEHWLTHAQSQTVGKSNISPFLGMD